MEKRRRWHRMYPVVSKQAYFQRKPEKVLDRWQLLRSRGRKEISLQAQLKLEWIIYYHTAGQRVVKETASHFGITRKTLHKWLKRFDEKNLRSLEENSRAPIHVRQRQIGVMQKIRIRSLRKKHLKYGKMKIQKKYLKEYGEYISSWKIQKVIEEGDLYPDKALASKVRRKRQLRAKHASLQRITKLKKELKSNFLWHVDTVILTIPKGGYRYLLTAIDEVSKLAYARLYTTHSSKQAKDFLERLNYLTEQRIINIHHDNGSEFRNHFEKACRELKLPQWLSRPYTPQDNAVLERFNRTIQEEFIQMSDVSAEDIAQFNNALLDWLIEYNLDRPHQTLDYQTPLEYLDTLQPQVSPMYSSSTSYSNIRHRIL